MKIKSSVIAHWIKTFNRGDLPYFSTDMDMSLFYYIALKYGDNENLLQLLLDGGVCINHISHAEGSVLEVLLRRGKGGRALQAVKFLLKNGALANSEEYGENLSAISAFAGNYNTFLFLHENKNLWNWKPEYDNQALSAALASACGDYEKIYHKIKNDIKSFKESGVGCEILHYAASTGNESIFDDAIKVFGCINKTTLFGKNMLHYAARGGNLKIVKKTCFSASLAPGILSMLHATDAEYNRPIDIAKNLNKMHQYGETMHYGSGNCGEHPWKLIDEINFIKDVAAVWNQSHSRDYIDVDAWILDASNREITEKFTKTKKDKKNYGKIHDFLFELMNGDYLSTIPQ